MEKLNLAKSCLQKVSFTLSLLTLSPFAVAHPGVSTENGENSTLVTFV